MDVSKTIETKISNYFRKKAVRYECNLSSLSILIKLNDVVEKVEIALYKDGKFLIWANLEEVLDLSFLELMVTNEKKVAAILENSVKKYEQEFNSKSQIAIYSNLEYYVLANYVKQKQITINDII